MVGYDSNFSLFSNILERDWPFRAALIVINFEDCEKNVNDDGPVLEIWAQDLGKLQIVCLQTASECTVQLRDINDDGCLLAWKAITIIWYRISSWHQSCIWVVWSMSQFVCVCTAGGCWGKTPRGPKDCTLNYPWRRCWHTPVSSHEETSKTCCKSHTFYVTLSVAIKLVGTQVRPPLFSIHNSGLSREEVVSLNQELELAILGVWYLASWQACIQRLSNYWELDQSSPFQ